MPIPLFLLDRLKSAPINGEHVADVFTKLAYVLDRTDSEGTITVEYVKETDQLQPGDLVPTISFSLQRQREANVVVDPEKVIDEEPTP